MKGKLSAMADKVADYFQQGASVDKTANNPGRKRLAKILSVLCSLVLLITLLLIAVQHNSTKLKFFILEYDKLRTAESIGMSQEELLETTKGLIYYIQGYRASLDMEATIKGEKRQVFNEREKAHMVDVQRLYHSTSQVKNAGILAFLLLFFAVFKLTGKYYWRYLSRGYLIGAAVFFGLCLILGFFILRDFGSFWMNFHYLFFSNDLWLLNPETDILIQMVPEQFFFDLVKKILIFFLFEAGLLALMTAYLLKTAKKG